MALAAMQGADQHIRSSSGFSISPEDTSTRGPGESNQRPSDNKMLALSQRLRGTLHACRELDKSIVQLR